mmetsp:Transcript_19139/g.29935  ORF Transcript_19139/g.29935 Transcript_19139/m.29935 type:complete len:117 (-) Transcript_19139:69-419(-)
MPPGLIEAAPSPDPELQLSSLWETLESAIESGFKHLRDKTERARLKEKMQEWQKALLSDYGPIFGDSLRAFQLEAKRKGRKGAKIQDSEDKRGKNNFFSQHRIPKPRSKSKGQGQG